MLNPKIVFSFLFSLLIATSCLTADTASQSGGWYLGVFGGIGQSESADLRQRGRVFLSNPLLPNLHIDADGRTGSSDVAFGGGHIGYEWDPLNAEAHWRLRPAAEVEGLYLGTHTPTGTMPVTPNFLGTQYVTIPMTAGVFLVNAVVTVQTPFTEKILPYVGAGFGAAFLSIEGADSANPSEPGINHFNSGPDASDEAFVLQLKAGIKAQVHPRVHLFFEYRFLSVDATNYTFGSTIYPGVHEPTSSWNVDLGRQEYHLFAAGLQLKF